MKVLIVGFDGQLGMDCQRVLQKDHTLLTPSIDEMDLCSEESVSSFLLKHKPEVTINCAAYTAVDRCEEETKLSQQLNGAGPGYLAKSCTEIGSRLIHVSTDYVFDGEKEIPEPYTEDDPVCPLSQYGRTKLEGEKEVQQYADDYVILRTAWLYSGHGPNFLKTMLRITLADPNAVRKVVNDQYGSLTWSYTLAKQIAVLIGSDIQGVIHTTSEGYSTWYDAACFFLETMGIDHNFTPCSTSEYPTPAHRPKNSILANKVLDDEQVSVFNDWKEDVQQFVQEYREKLLEECNG